MLRRRRGLRSRWSFRWFSSGGRLALASSDDLSLAAIYPPLAPPEGGGQDNRQAVALSVELSLGCVSRARDLSLGSASQSTLPLTPSRRKGDRTSCGIVKSWGGCVI